jgi:hypothetical protein
MSNNKMSNISRIVDTIDKIEETKTIFDILELN